MVVGGSNGKKNEEEEGGKEERKKEEEWLQWWNPSECLHSIRGIELVFWGSLFEIYWFDNVR